MCMICACTKFLEDKSNRVYPEIIQTSTLGRPQKKSLKRNDCLYRNGKSENSQRTICLVRKITFKQIVEVLFQCFEKALE